MSEDFDEAVEEQNRRRGNTQPDELMKMLLLCALFIAAVTGYIIFEILNY